MSLAGSFTPALSGSMGWKSWPPEAVLGALAIGHQDGFFQLPAGLSSSSLPSSLRIAASCWRSRNSDDLRLRMRKTATPTTGNAPKIAASTKNHRSLKSSNNERPLGDMVS